MIEHDGFLQAIIENPDDDGLRLIYADWLEDHDQPERADFIRVQCELANMGACDPQRRELEVREKLLLTTHEREWSGAWQGLGERWTFRRGFVEEIEIQTEMFLKESARVFRLAPVRVVRFTSVDGRLTDLLRSPNLRRLSTLDLTLNEFGDNGAAELAAADSLNSLQGLVLGGCGIGPDGVGALVSSPYLRNLTSLDLSGNSLSWCENIANRFRNWQLIRLTELSLQGTFIDIGELTLLPCLAGLNTLDLGENDLHFEDPDAQKLADCVYLSGLRSLKLRHDNIGVEGARILASSANLGSLASLDLSCNYIEPDGVAAVLSPVAFPGLRNLDIAANGLEDEAARVVAQAPGLANLAKLRFSYNHIADVGALALAESPYVAGLGELDLSHNKIGDAGANALIRSRHLGRLRVLGLAVNEIGESVKGRLTAEFGCRVDC